MRKHLRLSISFASLTLVAALATACGGPPTEALDKAEKALLDAAWAKECAEESYRAAQAMLDEAKAASEAGDYDEAERKAEAAARLAEQARADSEANREECERRKNALADLNKKLDSTDPDDKKDVIATSFTLETVYFDFDESALTEAGRTSLDANAKWLQSNATVRVRLTGHTDERGSTEYNLALSDRRADSVRRYLSTVGIDGTRMNAVPYGEERPASFGSSEKDHALNRRVEFEVME